VFCGGKCAAIKAARLAGSSSAGGRHRETVLEIFRHRSSTSCTSRRCIFGVVAPAFHHRHNPARMNGSGIVRCGALSFIVRIDHFVVRIRELKSGPRLHETEQDDVDVRPEDVLQERLIHPHGPYRARAVANHGFENPETWTARGAKLAALNATGDGHVLAGLESGYRLQVAAIFVADGKAIEKIFNRGKADPLKIGRALRSDAFQKL
jgi:hypothetical protein